MTTKPADEMKLGELLLKRGLINERQFEEAFLIQQQQKEYKPIGEILRELGYISRTALRDVLHRYQRHIQLGKLLVKMGAISETMLLKGLLLQQRTPDRLGNILVRTSEISHTVLADALSIQLTIPAIKPDLELMDKELLKEINANFLYQHHVIPVSRNKEEQAVTVIMRDPLDMETVMALEKIFNEKIEPAILAHGEIKHILDALLDPWGWARPAKTDAPLSNPFKTRLSLRTVPEPGPRSTWKIS
jgi:hypothetical protein